MKTKIKRFASAFLGALMSISSSYSSLALLYDIPHYDRNTPLTDSYPWDGGMSEDLDGQGTKDSPFIIKSANDLAYVAHQTNDEGNDYSGSFFRIDHNLDFGFRLDWIPVGRKDQNDSSNDRPFKGEIQGNGAVFKNLVMEDRNGQDVSIFGNLVDAKISDLTISGTVRLTSVGKSPVTFERKNRIDGKVGKEVKDIGSVCNKLNPDGTYSGSSGYRDEYLAWTEGREGGSGVEINEDASGRYLEMDEDKFRNDVEDRKNLVTYTKLKCEIGDENDFDYKVIDSQNRCRYVKSDLGCGNGGNVGIFGNVSGNSELSGIKNYAILESYGGFVSFGGNISTFYPDSYGTFAGRGVFIEVTRSRSKKTVNWNAGGNSNEGYVNDYSGYLSDKDYKPWGSDALTINEYREALGKFKGEEVTEEETIRTMKDNIERYRHDSLFLLEGSDGEEYCPYYINKSSFERKLSVLEAGQGGSVGMVAKAESTSDGSSTITFKDCGNYAEVSSCGGSVLSGDIIYDSYGAEASKRKKEVLKRGGCEDRGGNGGDAGGLIGESFSNISIKDCENHGSVSANGGGVKNHINIDSIFKSKGGDGGSSGGFIGCANSGDNVYTVSFEGKCVNSGKIEAESGENPETTGGHSGGALNRGTGGRRSTGLCAGNNADGGSAGGFIGESYAEVILSSKSLNKGSCNASGFSVSAFEIKSSREVHSYKHTDEEYKNFLGIDRITTNIFAGSGGKSGGFVGYSAEDVTISDEIRNEGNISANGGTTSVETDTKGSTNSGNGGVAGGIIGQAEKEVRINAKSSNSGKITAQGGARHSENCDTGAGGIAGAAIGNAKSNVTLKNFTNEMSGTINASGGKNNKGEAGKAGILGDVEGDIDIFDTINRATIRSEGNDKGFYGGEAGFLPSCSGNIRMLNCQNIGKIVSDGGGISGFITQIQRNKKAEISNSSNIGDISSDEGTAGFIAKSRGEISIINSYSSCNIKAKCAARIVADLSNSNMTIDRFYCDKSEEIGLCDHGLGAGSSWKDGVIERESEQMKNKEFAKLLNSNAIELNNSNVKKSANQREAKDIPPLWGWILGDKENDGHVLLCPGEFADVAIEIVSIEERDSALSELRKKCTPPCEHNLPDEDGSASDEIQGSGSKDDPYIIDSGKKLLKDEVAYWYEDKVWFRDSEDKYYKFVCNIDAGCYIGGGGNKTFAGNIGSDEKPFKGHIIGNGAIIKNLNGPLFGCIEGAEITDLMFDSSCVLQESVGTDRDKAMRASSGKGLITVARGDNTIKNVESYTKIFAAGENADVGGIVRTARGMPEDGAGTLEFINCANYGEVFTSGLSESASPAGDAGGLVGDASCNVLILDCKNEGKITSFGLGMSGLVGSSGSGVNAVFQKGVGKSGNAGGLIGAADGETVTIAGDCINKGDIRASSNIFSCCTGCGWSTGLSTACSGMSSGTGADGGNAGGFIGYSESDVRVENGSNCKNYGKIIADGSLSGSTGLVNGQNDNICGGNGGNAGGLIGVLVGNFTSSSSFENVSDISANGGKAEKHGHGGDGGNAGGLIGLCEGKEEHSTPIVSTYRTENRGNITAKGGDGSSPSFEEKIYRFIDRVTNDFLKARSEYNGDLKYIWQKGNRIGIIDGESQSTDDIPNSWEYRMFRKDRLISEDGTDSFSRVGNFQGKIIDTNKTIRTLDKLDFLGDIYRVVYRTLKTDDGREICIGNDGKLKKGTVFARNKMRGYRYSGWPDIKFDNRYLTAFSAFASDKESEAISLRGGTYDGYEVYSNNEGEKYSIALIKRGNPNYENNNFSTPIGIFSQIKYALYPDIRIYIYDKDYYYDRGYIGLDGANIERNKDYFFVYEGTVYCLSVTGGNDNCSVTLKDESGNVMGSLTKGGQNPDNVKNILLSRPKILFESVDEANQNLEDNIPYIDLCGKNLFISSVAESLETDEIDGYFNKDGEVHHLIMSNDRNNGDIKIKLTKVVKDNEEPVIDIVYPKVGEDGLLSVQNEPVTHNGIQIKVGEKSQTLKYDTNEEDYEKRLVGTFVSEGTGGNGGDGGCAGAFVGKIYRGNAEIDNFKNAEGVRLVANCGIGGISNSETEKSSHDGNGGYAGLVGKSGSRVLRTRNVQLKENDIIAEGANAGVGFIGKVAGSIIEIINSFMSGKLFAESGSAGIVGKVTKGGRILADNFYCSSEVSASNKGMLCGVLVGDSYYFENYGDFSIKNLYLSSKYCQNDTPLFGIIDSEEDLFIPSSEGLISSGSLQLIDDEKMNRIEFVSALNRRAAAYNLGLDQNLTKKYASGWIRSDKSSHPHLLNNDIDPSKMIRSKAQTPKLDYITDESIKIEERENQEFSIDLAQYQDFDHFDSLAPLTRCNVYAREKEGYNIECGEESDPLQVRTLPTKIYDRIGKAREWIIDPKTNINFIFSKDAFVDGASMHAEEVDENHSNYSISRINTDDRGQFERIKYYDINMLDKDGKKIQPNGHYAMLIPVPEDFDLTEEDLRGFCIKPGDDEKFDTDDDIIYIDNQPYYLLVSDHFSSWALADLVDKDETPDVGNNSGGISDGSSDDNLDSEKLVETTDSYKIFYLLLALILSSAALGCLIYAKKKKSLNNDADII